MCQVDVAVNLLVFNGLSLDVALDSMLHTRTKLVELAFTEGYADFDEANTFTESSAVDIRNQLEKRGLKCQSVAAHIDLGNEDSFERFCRRIYFTYHMGSKILISNSSFVKKEKVFLENIKRLSGIAGQLDITIALENPGDGAESLIPNGKLGSKLIRELSLPNVQLNYDYSNAISYSGMNIDAETDSFEAITNSANLHLKEFTRDERNRRWVFCAIGEGTHNYSSFFKNVNCINPRIPMSLELPLHMYRSEDLLMRRMESNPSIEQIISTIDKSLSNIEQLMSKYNPTFQ